MKNWNIRLKELREEKGLTQGELAERSGLKRAHISRLEGGDFLDLKTNVLEKLAVGFGLTRNQLTIYLFGKSFSETDPDIDTFIIGLREHLKQTDMMDIPYKGYIDAGGPVPSKLGGSTKIHKEELLREIEEMQDLGTYKVCGNKYVSDDIDDGDDLVTIETQEIIEDNQLYVIEDKPGTYHLARLHKENGDVIVVSDGKITRCPFQNLVIKGLAVISLKVKRLRK